MTTATRFRPIKVTTIDVEACPERITDGGEHAALWALVRERGRPRGMIQVPFTAGGVRRDDLQEAIAALPAGSLDPAPQRSDAVQMPSITVVIPSMLERADGLQECLRSLTACDYPDYEVIVVDNRPTGAAPQAVEGARVIRETVPGISAARNAGLAAAHGEIVAFTDDDVVVDPAWLLAIAVRLLDHPDEACVTGLALPRELQTPAQVGLEEYYGGFGPRVYEPVSHRMQAAGGHGPMIGDAAVEAVGSDGRVRRTFSLYAAGSFGPGANMAFRTQALRAAGGFDLSLGAGTACRGGEDLVMFARLAWRGHAIGFEPAAVVHHTHRAAMEDLERQIHGYGVGYGALLMALVLEDPRHLGRILATAGRAVTTMIHGYRARAAVASGALAGEATGATRNRDLARMELRGMATGPVTYLRTRRRRPR